MSRFWLIALVAAHFILAIAFAAVTPYRSAGFLASDGGRTLHRDIGAPDERQHVNYIARIARGGGFPVLGDPNADPGENYQAHQPPLFYILAAGWAKLGFESAFDGPGGGVGLRALNAFIGAAGVWGIFALAWWITRREDIALGAAGFAALLPMNVALSGAVSNDPLLFALCSWSLAILARAMRQGWNAREAVLLGGLLGLASLTKTSAIALLPAVVVGMGISFRAGHSGALKWGLIALALAVLLPAPWWARNQSLYGDPLALRAFEKAFPGSPAPADVLVPELLSRDEALMAKANAFADAHPDLQGRELVRALDSELGVHAARHPDYWTRWVGWWTLRSFLGVFSYMDIFLPAGLYAGAALVFGVLFVLGGMRLIKDQEARSLVAPGAAFLLVVVLLFVRFNLTYFQGQARYLFPALGVFGLFVAAGAVGVAGTRARPALAALALALVAVDLYALSLLPEQFAQRVRASRSLAP